MTLTIFRDSLNSSSQTQLIQRIPVKKNLLKTDPPRPAGKIAFNLTDKKYYGSNGSSWDMFTNKTFSQLLKQNPNTGNNPILFPQNDDISNLASYLSLPTVSAQPTDDTKPVGTIVASNNGNLYIYQGSTIGWAILGAAGGIVSDSVFIPTAIFPAGTPLFDIILNTAYAGGVNVVNGRHNFMFGEISTSTPDPPRNSNTVKMVFNANKLLNDNTTPNPELGSFRVGISPPSEPHIFPTFSVAFGDRTSINGADYGFVHGQDSSAHSPFAFVHGNTNIIETGCNNSVIIGGHNNRITNASNSAIIGGQNLTLNNNSDTLLVQNLEINGTIGGGPNIPSNVDFNGNNLVNVSNIQTIFKSVNGAGLQYQCTSNPDSFLTATNPLNTTIAIRSFFIFEYQGTNTFPISATVTVHFQLRLTNDTGSLTEFVSIKDISNDIGPDVIGPNIFRFNDTFRGGGEVFIPGFASIESNTGSIDLPIYFKFNPATANFVIKNSSGGDILLENGESILIKSTINYLIIRTGF